MIFNRKSVFIMILAASGLFMAACQTLEQAKDNIGEAKVSIEEDIEGLRSEISGGGVENAGLPYFGDTIRDSALNSNGMPLPEFFETDDALELSVENATLRQVLELVQRDTGINTNFVTSYTDNSGEAIVLSATRRFSLLHKGSLSKLFDKIAVHTDTAWSYDGTTVTFDRFKLVSYNLPILPHSTQGSGSVGVSSDGGGSGGSTASVGLSSTFDSDPWADLEARLRSFAPPPSQIYVSRGIGVIDVFASPSVQRKVSKIIEETHDIYSQTIQLEVAVYFVDVNKVNDFAVGLGLKSGDFSFIGAAGQVATTGSGVLGYNQNGGFANGGSSAQLRALATDASVADSYFATTRVQPGMVAPLVNTESSNYVSGTTVTTSQTASSTAITTNSFASGMMMFSVAQLSEEGEIVVETTISQNNLKRLRLFSAGGNSVQLPDSSSRIIKGSGVVRSGGMLVLAGYTQDYDKIEDSGTGVPQNKLLGGATTGEIKRVQMFAVIRPTLVGS